MASAHVFLNPWVCSTNPTRNTENLGDDGAYTGGARKADATGSSGAEEGGDRRRTISPARKELLRKETAAARAGES
jgi:hypothetical protein